MKLIKKNLVLTALLLSAMSLRAQVAFTIEDLTGSKGATIDMPVCLSNPDLEILSFDVKIILPEGVTIATNAKGNLIANLSDRKDDHVINCSAVPSGGYRYISYSANNNSYEGSEGVMFTSPIKLDVEPGVYEITITGGSVAVVSSDGSINPCECENTTATLTVTEPEEIRYTDNQLYAKDVKINKGEDATLLVAYNSASDVYEYETTIVLPEGVAVTDVAFESVVADVTNFNNDWKVNGDKLTLIGEYGGRRNKPAQGGNKVFAKVNLSTASLAAGTYEIKLTDQLLVNDDEEAGDDGYTPEDYVAKLVVEDTAVCIESVLNDSNKTIYNTQGQRMTKAQRGVNIINGKKLVLK